MTIEARLSFRLKTHTILPCFSSKIKKEKSSGFGYVQFEYVTIVVILSS